MVVTIGMETYQRIQRLEKQIQELGFKFKPVPWHSRSGDQFVIIVDSDRLPVYRENAEIFNGTLEEVESWAIGIDWARKYDLLLGLKTDQRRERIEKRMRNRALIERIKNSDQEKEDEPPF
jgi:hypothetical protein